MAPGDASTPLEFEVLDVFTRTPFEGNPLAVVLGGEELTTRQMQALAVEFALSETVFPLLPDDAEHARGVDYRVRIFTPAEELPFAGHPSVGTAWLMAQRGTVRPGRVVQACGAGDLPLEVAPKGGEVTLTGGMPTSGPEVDAEQVAAALGLARADLVDPPPRIARSVSPCTPSSPGCSRLTARARSRCGRAWRWGGRPSCGWRSTRGSAPR